MTYLIFDTETTGLPLHPSAKDEVQPRIIEWGGCLVNSKGEILDELDILINPGMTIPPRITEITGITDADVKWQPRFSKAAKTIRGYFEKADALIAHNLPFDKSMMTLEIARNNIKDWPWPNVQICTVQEHAEAWGRRPKLLELYEHHTGNKLAQTHRALDDVHALLEICQLAGILI